MASTAAPVAGTSEWFPFVIVFAFAFVVVGGILLAAWFFFRGRHASLPSSDAPVLRDYQEPATAGAELQELDASEGVNLEMEE